MNILIVEDDTFIADSLADFLSKEGYTVIGKTRSLNETITWLKDEQNNPDFALLDIELDGSTGNTDGIIVAEQITCPHVFLTSFMNAAVQKAALATKPIGNGYYIKNEPRTLAMALRAYSNNLIQAHEEQPTTNYRELVITIPNYEDGERGSRISVRLTEIMAVTAKDKDTFINLTNNRTYRIQSSLRQFLESLSQAFPNMTHPLVRISKDTIFNLDYFSRKVGTILYMNQPYLRNPNQHFFVGESYVKELEKRMPLHIS